MYPHERSLVKRLAGRPFALLGVNSDQDRKVLQTVIPRSVKVSEAPGYGMSIIDYDPGSRGAMSYLDASRELAYRGAGGQTR